MSRTRPDRVAVVGAGIVGLSTAWFLQEHGAVVTVLDSTGVAAGASWGNAGWVTPGLAAPLPEPAVLRYGLRAALLPSSPVYVPPRADLGLLRFLARFVRNCTTARWRRAASSLAELSRTAYQGYDVLMKGGVDSPVLDAAPLVAAYRTPAEAQTLLHEVDALRANGLDVSAAMVSGAEATARVPLLSDAIGAAVLIGGQRYVDPAHFTAALAKSVRARGGTVLTGLEVTRVHEDGVGVVVSGAAGPQRFDAVVLATGARLGALARPFGVRAVVQAGRGYSFSVAVSRAPTGPMYLPAQRVACTPLAGRLRLAGMMEFRRPEDPLDPRRIASIVDAVRPLVRGVELDDRRDEWVGSRPCTVDGLPLVGPTRSPRVVVAGGHGMWGVTLGPATGMLLASYLATGERAAALAPFDPLR
nr:FAD-dependent oxidoreductase [Jiangella asiatica]